MDNDVRFCFAEPIAQYLMDDSRFMADVASSIGHVEFSQDVFVVARLVEDEIYRQYRDSKLGGDLLSDLVFNILELTDSLRIGTIIVQTLFEEACI